MQTQINLDQAASSSPKAPGTAEAVYKALLGPTVNINRSTYREENQKSMEIFRIREELKRFFDAPESYETVFFLNITQALNAALRGLLKEGDHVLISGLEHHAVTRTLGELGVSYTVLPSDSTGAVLPDQFDACVQENTKAVVLNHASNVCGTIQPASEIFKLAKTRGLTTILDSAQTAGSLPLSITDLACDIFCFTGHKGLLGPQGVGGMILSQETALKMRPIFTGGTGSHSESFIMPEELPDKFEAGTLNLPGIIGLGEALRYLNTFVPGAIYYKEHRLTQLFVEEVKKLPGVRIAGGDDYQKERMPVISLSFPEGPLTTEEIAAILDKTYQIAVRCGLHCAPLAHQTLGTYPEGTIRFSLGAFTTEEDIDQTLSALEEILTGKSSLAEEE